MINFKNYLEESAAAVKKMKDMEDKRRRDQQAAKKRAEDDTPSKPKVKTAPSKPETSAERKARRHQQDQSDFSKVAARHREEASKHEQKAKEHSEKTKGIKGKLFGGKHKEAAKLHTAAAAAHHAAASVADKVHKDAGGKKTSYSGQKDYHKHSNAATDAGFAAHRHQLGMKESFNEATESYIAEKLKATDKMGDWVKDFQDSDAPQFKGKSQKKRQQMAVAAKLGAERDAGMREEVELDEKAYVSSLSPELGRKGSHDVIGKDGKVVKSYPYTKQGMKLAQKHLSKMKEEVELDEQAQYDLVEAYLLENNIDIDSLTEEELNELIGKVIGGAFKAGAKAVVGAGRLAKKAANRMSTDGRAAAAEKRADAAEKRNKDRERIEKARQRLRDAQKAAREAKSGTTATT